MPTRGKLADCFERLEACGANADLMARTKKNGYRADKTAAEFWKDYDTKKQ